MTQETHRSVKGSMTVPQDILDEIVRRIVEVAQPDRIILFGSAARGEMGPDSDLDLLVVKAGVPHRRRLAQAIHRNLFGVGVPVDIIVVTPEDIQAFQDKVGTIIGPALKESHCSRLVEKNRDLEARLRRCCAAVGGALTTAVFQASGMR